MSMDCNMQEKHNAIEIKQFQCFRGNYGRGLLLFVNICVLCFCVCVYVCLCVILEIVAVHQISETVPRFC